MSRLPTNPICFPASPEEFESSVRFRAWEEIPHPNLSTEKLIVGEQQGTIAGFAHVALASADESASEDMGLIRFLTYPPGNRAVGQAILEIGGDVSPRDGHPQGSGV